MWRIPKAGEIVKDEYTNKTFLLAEQKRLTERFRSSLTKSQVEMSPCFSNFPSPNVQQYDRVSLKELKSAPNNMLLGKVCVCRTISPSIKTLSLLTIVEFPEVYPKNEAAFLTLTNSQLLENEENENSIPVFPIGTILTVFNPMFFQAYVNKIYTVRCDNPANVSVLSQSEFKRLFPGLKWRSGEVMNQDLSIFSKLWPYEDGDWMSVGKYWFDKRNYIGAIKAYSLVLENDRNIDALMLRSYLYYKLKVYKKSLKDSEEILNLVPFHEAAIFYRASSLISLSQYAMAITFLECNISRCSASSDSGPREKFQKLLLKAKTRNKQERDGDYDMLHILGCSMNHIHDCADYTGCVIEKDVPGRGRGMIATENIKCGDLILGAKALETVIHTEEEEIPMSTLDMETLNSRSRSDVRLNEAIAHRVMQDPDVAKLFDRLYDGTPRSSVFNGDEPFIKSINLRRIAAICNHNSFSRPFTVGTVKECISGVWPSASQFNHGGIDSNSSWTIYGNLILVRASRDIMQGEEITIAYIPFTTQYHERYSYLLEYDFVCKCTLCSLESKESSLVHDWRKEKLKGLTFEDFLADVTPMMLEMQIKEIEEQRSDNPDLNVYTFYPKIRLAEFHMRKARYIKASGMLRSVYQYSCKTVLSNASLSCCLYGMICALRCRDLENAKLWASDMTVTLIQIYGMSSEELLKCRSRHVAELMAEYGIVL